MRGGGGVPEIYHWQIFFGGGMPEIGGGIPEIVARIVCIWYTFSGETTARIDPLATEQWIY